MANKVESKYKTQAVEQDVFNINKAPLMDDTWSHYLAWAKLNKRTWKNDRMLWTYHIESYVKGLKLDRITPQLVQTIINDVSTKPTVKGKPYAPATVKHVLVLLKRVINWSINQRLYHGSNPCATITMPKFDNRVTNPLNIGGLKSLLSVLDTWENERAVLVIKFALYSGKRKGEILKLTWNNVDLQNGYITLQATNTKSKKTQVLPINKHCRLVLERCRKLQVSDYVFPCSTGKYFIGFTNTWHRIRRKAGIEHIRFHDLRHTYASYLASSGKVDIYTLKELLGHSTLEMTQRYAHLVNGALQKAVNVADDVFGK